MTWRGAGKNRTGARVLEGMQRVSMAILVVILAAACLVPAAAAAGPAPARNCASADLRYPFQPGGPKAFGVFRLQVSGGRCATAHRVAQAWMTRFEAAFRAGRTLVPRSVDGFKFETVPARLSQTFRERGRMGTTTIMFDYRIPNG